MIINVVFDQECDFEVALDDSCVIPIVFSNDNIYVLHIDADD